MIVQDTIDDIIKYCEQLIFNIKRRQRILGNQADIKNSLGVGNGGWDIVQSINYTGTMQNTRATVRFTPNNSTRPLSNIDINFSLVGGGYTYSHMVTVASSANVGSNFIEYVVTVPYVQYFTGTLYIKTKARSLDTGTITYTVVTI